ncbi:MAG: hypothetical protein ACI8S6_004808 [Myxococcota bacterium]|jgi:hypothetical protein
MRSAGHHLILMLSGLFASPALAQSPDELPEVTPEVVPVAPPRAVPWADSYQWRSLDFRRSATSLAYNSRGKLIVLDANGTVYLQEGRGLWAAVLDGGLGLEQELDEEELLLDAESAVEDFTDTTDEDQGSTEVEVDGQVEEVEQVASADLSDAVDIGIQDADDRFGGLQRAPEVIWASQAVPGLLITSRRGEEYRSINDGKSWSRIDDLPPAYDFVELPSAGLIIAATGQGLYTSSDRGESWQEGDPTLRGIATYDLDTDGTFIYAAGAEGIWQSVGGRRWGKLLPPRYADLNYLAVVLDRDWTGGLWAATAEQGILRSDDAGQTFRPVGRNPLLGTTALAPIYDAPGHLLASGQDGVWESTDGGLRWQPLSDGLPGPDVVALLVEGAERPVIATPDGVFELKRPEPVTTEAVEGGEQGGLPVEAAVKIALRRAGISQDPFEVQRRFTRALLTPRLRLQAEYQADDYINSDYSAIKSTRVTTDDWKLSLDLCFGGCSVSSSLIADSADAFSGPELAVIGSDVYQTDDSVSSIAPAAANVAQRLSQYRGDVAGYVTDLYFTRQRLLAEEEGLSALPLDEQIRSELEMQEIIARLDIYTDGRYSASLQNP